MGLELWEGAVKEKRNPHLGKPPNQQGDELRMRDLKVTEKSAAAGLRREKQSENLKDHLHTTPETTAWETLVGTVCWDSGSRGHFWWEDYGWLCGDSLRGWGAMCHDLGSRTPELRESRRRSGPTGKQSATVGGGQEEEKWTAIGLISAHMQALGGLAASGSGSTCSSSPPIDCFVLFQNSEEQEKN